MQSTSEICEGRKGNAFEVHVFQATGKMVEGERATRKNRQVGKRSVTSPHIKRADDRNRL